MEIEINNTIDLSYLEATFSGNKEIINKVLQSFMKNTPELLIELNDRAINNDWENVKMIAHKIKSSFNTIGAKRIGDILLKIELASNDSDSSNVLLLISEANSLSESVFEEIKEKLSE